MISVEYESNNEKVKFKLQSDYNLNSIIAFCQEHNFDMSNVIICSGVNEALQDAVVDSMRSGVITDNPEDLRLLGIWPYKDTIYDPKTYDICGYVTKDGYIVSINSSGTTVNTNDGNVTFYPRNTPI